jgi:hypothetical protein
VFLASLLRAAYFTQPESVQPSWAYYLMSGKFLLFFTNFSQTFFVYSFLSSINDLCVTGRLLLGGGLCESF